MSSVVEITTLSGILPSAISGPIYLSCGIGEEEEGLSSL
jgi:hypothetical protein